MTSPRERTSKPNFSRVHSSVKTKFYDASTSFFQDFINHTKTFSVFTARDMLLFLKGKYSCCKLIASLLPQLSDLIARMMSTTRKHVYVVPLIKGTKQPVSNLLPVSHCPRMIALYHLCVELCNHILAVHARRTKCSRASVQVARKQPLAMTTSPREHTSQKNVPRVHFAVNTKKHDGLSPATNFFQDFINHTEKFSVFTQKDMLLFLRGMPQCCKLIVSLLPQLRHLIARMMSTTRNHVFVVPVMEGTKLPISNLPRMIALYGVCERVCKRLFLAHIRRTKRLKAIHSKQKSTMDEDQGQQTKCKYSKREHTGSDKRKVCELKNPASGICCKRTRLTEVCSV